MARLSELLQQKSPEELLAFDQCFLSCIQSAYHWDLWGVAFLLMDGCSDDAFDYFLGWLIAQGKARFENACQAPESLADWVRPSQPLQCEDIWSVAARAYEKTTGKKDFYQRTSSVSRTLLGEPWEEDDVARLFPKVAEKFCPRPTEPPTQR